MKNLTIEDVLACPAIPSLPTVAVRILELTRDPDMDFNDLTDAVQQDQAITARVLRTINSSYYALSRPCNSISRALAYLGVTTVKSLVLGFSLVDATRDQSGLDLDDYWRRAIVSATASRRLAGVLGWGDTEVAFIAGLLQDIGMFAMGAAYRDEYEAVLAETGGDHGKLAALERERFGFDHAEVGGRLAEAWRLPLDLIEAIRGHHETNDLHADLTRLTNLSGSFATALDLPDAAAQVRACCTTALQWFDLQRGVVETALAVVGEDVRELSSLFNVHGGPPIDVNRLLVEAEDTRLVQQIAFEREREGLRAANEELERRTMTDPLTSVGNRGRFEEAMDGLVLRTQSDGTPFGLLLVDADHFKQLNDTMGHQAGDAVLVDIASRIVKAVRDTDLVCRYGGEEFAVLLPGADGTATERAAERVRRAVGDTPIAVPCENSAAEDEARAVTVTVSVGATIADAQTALMRRDKAAIIRAADQALYAAKEAGRDRVRVGRFQSRSAA